MPAPTPEVRLQRFEKLSLDLEAELPNRVWVEGDGRMYGSFGADTRRRINEFDAIKLLHHAYQKAAQLVSV